MMEASSAVIEPAAQPAGLARRSLDAIFFPKTIALVGASDRPGSVGHTVLSNLISHPFGGTVFAVNPKRRNVAGIPSYADVGCVPEAIDLAVVATPASTVPSVIRSCADAGVKAAIVISAGFKECGPQGAMLEQYILVEARRGGMRLLGPNCLGVMNPWTGLNATFAAGSARPGNVAFLSQSGAFCTAILDWSLQENIGFSAFVSLGSLLDIGWGDLIDYLGNDPKTESIIVYMESIGDARSFLSAAREVALTKPIIAIKAGRTEAGARAATSHTGSLTGSDEVLDAAFRRAGVLRVHTIAELFHMTEVLAKQRRPKGRRLAIITNAGGPGVLAADTLIAEGGQLAPLSAETSAALCRAVPGIATADNPVDLRGDALAEHYAKAAEIVAMDPNVDGLLVILAPQAMTDSTRAAEKLKEVKTQGKPILASWMGGASIAAGEAVLNAAGIPTFGFPDTAARTFAYMWRYSDNLRALYETPALVDSQESLSSRTRAEEIIATVRQSGRLTLTEVESKQVLSAYEIPVVETRVAATEEEVLHHAAELGYPVVLKIHSQAITHKTDVGGVFLNLVDEASLQWAYRAMQWNIEQELGPGGFREVTVQPMIQNEDGYELILGSASDPQFGPVLLFGSGGQLVEVIKDRAVGLPPLNLTLARRIVEQTTIFRALQGVRGRRPVDLGALERLMVRFSQLVIEQRWIKEIDINPVLASPDGIVALDARIVVHGADVDIEQLPKLAIRPYPARYASPWKLKDATAVTIRPIRPDDEPLMREFHATLSDETVFHRYFHMVSLSQRVAHERLSRMCFIDYDRQMALVAERQGPEREILGVGRLVKSQRGDEGEFAILVGDRYQKQGLGTELLRRLVEFGREEKLARITADILPDNLEMQRVSKKIGFELRFPVGDVAKAEIRLDGN